MVVERETGPNPSIADVRDTVHRALDDADAARSRPLFFDFGQTKPSSPVTHVGLTGNEIDGFRIVAGDQEEVLAAEPDHVRDVRELNDQMEREWAAAIAGVALLRDQKEAAPAPAAPTPNGPPR